MAAEPARRILLTADTVGGVWPFAIELAGQLLGAGDRVLLAAMGGVPNAAQRDDLRALPGIEFHWRPYKLVWMREPWDDLEAAADWLHDLAGQFRPDVIHLNDLALADHDWPAPVLQGVHSCVCSWWQAVRGEAAPREWDRYRARVAASVQAADHIVAPSAAMLEAVAAHYGAPASAEVIANGRSAPAASTRAKEPFVLGAGRLWDEAKNLSALDAAAARLPWPVYVAGAARSPEAADGDPVAQWQGVRPLGALPNAELREWMACAGIYALPARYEPFGLSALEAAQAGCALVLGDIPSLREVWAEAAVYVPPSDTAALQAALLRLIDDAALRHEMGQRARLRAQRYTPEAMSQRYRHAYAALSQRPAPCPPPLVRQPFPAGAHA
ncbi:MAG TPA: glycosyltransferase family 4 protein [Stenotrophomonas sp.]|nr:glycosyltransferase family 4 protein [Stenotrophomonas sp.]